MWFRRVRGWGNVTHLDSKIGGSPTPVPAAGPPWIQATIIVLSPRVVGPEGAEENCNMLLPSLPLPGTSLCSYHHLVLKSQRRKLSLRRICVFFMRSHIGTKLRLVPKFLKSNPGAFHVMPFCRSLEKFILQLYLGWI